MNSYVKEEWFIDLRLILIMEITIHTGNQNDQNKINIDWFDHNGINQKTGIIVSILPQDKPRTLQITINGVIIATIQPNYD